jgi:uncharacterized LabA/DUF88 family protein
MTRPRVLILADTPNLYRSAVRAHGPGVWLDYEALLGAARQFGTVRAEAVVNDGVSAKFVEWLRRIGYTVTFSHADDVDEMLIARAVALHRSTDSLVVASGDGKNAELIRMFKAMNRSAVVAGIDGSIHQGLRAVADAVLDFPVRVAPSRGIGRAA